MSCTIIKIIDQLNFIDSTITHRVRLVQFRLLPAATGLNPSLAIR